jgi:hypothetical protein
MFRTNLEESLHFISLGARAGANTFFPNEFYPLLSAASRQNVTKFIPCIFDRREKLKTRSSVVRQRKMPKALPQNCNVK